jgi:hypothetical protein
MAAIYPVFNETDGSDILPVGDATLETRDFLNTDTFENGVFVIQFYNANNDPVTPTAGTIKPEMAPILGQWQEPSAGDVTIDATMVIAGVSTYTLPSFNGPAVQGRLTFSGITGAVTAKAFFWRA